MLKKMKLAVMALVAVFAIAAISQTASAQLDKKQEKNLTKKAKSEAKKLTKDGWEISGSSKMLEDALFQHYSKMETNQTTEQVGEVSQCMSVNVCRKNALFNAQTDYTQQVSAEVKGIADNINSNNPSLKLESDAFASSFVGKFKADVSGVLSESFSLVRDKNGTKEFRTYFVINMQKLGAARTSAMEAALKETNLTIDQINAVSKAIDDKFKEDDDAKAKAASEDTESNENDN